MYGIDAPIERRPPPPEYGRGPVWFYAAVIALVTAIVILGGIAIVLTLGDDETAATTSSSSATTAEPTTTGSASTATTLSSTTASTLSTTTSATLTSSTSTTDTTAATTSTSTTSSTSTTPTPTTNPALATAVWPWADSGISYDDPVEAALGFATDYVGYESPVAGEFMQGDSRSGEVEIRAVENGPVTVVLVRQLTADDSWWVLGSVAEGIVVDEPDALATIESPVVVSGRGRAVEGVAEVQLRVDGRTTPLGQATVAVGTNDTLVPFETSFSWSGATADRGAVVVVALTTEGEVWEATVLRVVLDGR